jgi:hypothetical protein
VPTQAVPPRAPRRAARATRTPATAPASTPAPAAPPASVDLVPLENSVKALNEKVTALEARVKALEDAPANPEGSVSIPSVRQRLTSWSWNKLVPFLWSLGVALLVVGALLALFIALKAGYRWYNGRQKVVVPRFHTVEVVLRRNFQKLVRIEDPPGSQTFVNQWKCTNCGEIIHERGPHTLQSHVEEMCESRP